LTGIVKRIDFKTKTVTVDVKSSSCHGFRTFAVDNVSEFEDFVDQKINFFIDSTTCKKKDEIYKMLPGAGVAK
jgi:hypothetical protein